MHPDQPSSAETRFLELKGGVVAYTDEGSGPILLCIHGIPGSKADFRWLAPALIPKLRVLRIDLPGFGDTPRAAHPYPGMESMALFVLQFIEAMNIERFALLGHSLGGAIATQAATDDRVFALALLSSAGPYSHRGHFPKTYKFLVPFANNPFSRPLIVFLGKKILRWVGFRIGDSDENLLAALECAASIDFKQHGDTLNLLAKPTMVAWAKDDRMVESKVGESLTQISPPGPRLYFDTGGHNIQKTRAIEIADTLCPWVQESSNRNDAKAELI
jgi:pimeloyl-ACP methyl ester carboxylesterase